MGYNLTLVASDQSPALAENHFDMAMGICAQHRINIADENITWLENGKAGQITLTDDLPIEAVILLRTILKDDKIDIFIIDEDFKAELLVADMESTIIPNEILDDLAAKYGIEDQVAEITARGMRGEIDFETSLRERIALLKGTTEEDLMEKRDSLEPNQGAEEFVGTLKKDGALCVLATGGFTYFSEKIAEDCGFDNHHANELDIENGALSGRVNEPILDGNAKLMFLNQYIEVLDITKEQTVRIGDGSNDIPMLNGEGLGIGYHPKPVVKSEIKNCILHGDFTAVLYAMGYTRDMFVRPGMSNGQQAQVMALQ